MRHTLFLAIALAGCSWTTFDDLGKEAWAQSEDSPNIGSTDYAVAIVGTSPTSSGGQLSVLSSDSVSYSTLVYDSKGGSSVGPNPQRLGQFFITSLGTQPIFVADAAGDCSVAAQASNGTSQYVVVYNACAMSPGATPITSTAAPDAAAYVGSTLVVAAGKDLFVSSANGFLWCDATDDAGAPLMAAGLGGDDANLWVWATSGKLLSYRLSDLSACVATSTMPAMGTPIASATAAVPTTFAPASGATVQVIGTSTSAHRFVVLAGHATQSASGRVFVAEADTTLALVGTPLMADGIQSAAVGQLGTGTYVAVGFPSNETGGTVELHALDTTTGVLNPGIDEKLADAQPDSGEQFGRSLAIVKYNGTNILAVAAKSEVFTYFRMDPIYLETRQK
jgi:hypothetical protein